MAEVNTRLYTYATNGNSHHTHYVRVSRVNSNSCDHHRIQHAAWLGPGMPSIGTGEHTVMRPKIDHSRSSPQGYRVQVCMRVGEWTTCHAGVGAVKTVID